jgi:hypothetical protein
MMRLKAKITAPLLSLALAGGLFSQMQRYAPDDTREYHADIAAAADDIPILVGEWHGTDVTMPPAAGQLLRPNVLFSRSFRRASDGERANLILVQCPDSRDMSGHYPPNCYPGNGWQFASPMREHRVEVWGRTIPVVEYTFTRADGARTHHVAIYNFMVLPTQGFVTNMEDLRRATGDYRARPYGAAQVQVMMDSGLPEEQRAEVLRQLLEPLGPVIELLQHTRTGESS